MDCAKHQNVPVSAYCRTCGKALCETCKRDVRGVIYCEDCLANRVQVPGSAAAAVPPPPPVSGPHPAVAGVLAIAPFGIAQAYNGQYARGLVYLLSFVGLIWATHDVSAYFGFGIAAFCVWQMIDAVRSAQFIQRGLPAPDPFGIDRAFGTGSPMAGRPFPGAAQPVAASGAANGVQAVAPAPAPSTDDLQSRLPMGALILIVVGALFLMSNFGVLHLHWIVDLWPMTLIAIGGWLLSTRWPEIATGSLEGRRRLMGPTVLLVLGGLFLMDTLTRVGFEKTFPILLIAIGLVKIWQRSAPELATYPQPTANSAPVPPPAGQPSPDSTSVGQEQER